MISINTSFKLTALRPNGTGVAGAQLRILTNAGTDVTAQLFGSAQLITDSFGVWAGRETGEIGPALVYTDATVQVVANHYQTWETTYPFVVLGIAHLTANLVREESADTYTVTPPDADYMSSMVPIVCDVEAGSSFDYEYIQARVELQDGSSSVIEAPVDTVSHLATLDIRNRVNLGIRPFLVKEPAIARPDTDFSTVATVTLSSLTEEGEAAIEGGFNVSVAATLPPDGDDDLNAYVGTSNKFWLVPSTPVYAFRGWYRDVMVWLPIPSLPGYVLTTKYYNGAGEVVSTTTDNLTESPNVQRIRLNTDPEVGVVRAELVIKSGSSITIQPLSVIYRD